MRHRRTRRAAPPSSATGGGENVAPAPPDDRTPMRNRWQPGHPPCCDIVSSQRRRVAPIDGLPRLPRWYARRLRGPAPGFAVPGRTRPDSSRKALPVGVWSTALPRVTPGAGPNTASWRAGEPARDELRGAPKGRTMETARRVARRSGHGRPRGPRSSGRRAGRRPLARPRRSGGGWRGPVHSAGKPRRRSELYERRAVGEGLAAGGSGGVLLRRAGRELGCARRRRHAACCAPLRLEGEF